ncbi:MAG: Dabb family protein [Clostridia bacterium]|nr:Dabb family protein [Clostridia bacterium]
MVKHIILWKLKAEFNNDEIKKQMKEKLEGLYGQIDGLLEIKVQTEKLESSNVDVMLYSVFTDEAALKNYATHEKHVFVADNFVRPFTESRFCIDYCEN